MSLMSLTAVELGRKIQEKEVTAGEATRAALEAIKAKEELEEWQDDESEKIRTIREIKGEGLEVIYIIQAKFLW